MSDEPTERCLWCQVATPVRKLWLQWWSPDTLLAACSANHLQQASIRHTAQMKAKVYDDLRREGDEIKRRIRKQQEQIRRDVQQRVEEQMLYGDRPRPKSRFRSRDQGVDLRGLFDDN